MSTATTSQMKPTEQLLAAERILRAERPFAEPEREQAFWIEESAGWAQFAPHNVFHLRDVMAVKLIGVHVNEVPERNVSGSQGRNAEVINQARRVLGLSMTQLAKVLGVSRKTVYNYKDRKVSSMSKQPDQRLTLLSLALNSLVNNHGTEFRSPPRALTVRMKKGDETVLDRLCNAHTLDAFKKVLENLVNITQTLEPSRPAKGLDRIEMLTKTRGSYFGPES